MGNVMFYILGGLGSDAWLSGLLFHEYAAVSMVQSYQGHIILVFVSNKHFNNLTV